MATHTIDRAKIFVVDDNEVVRRVLRGVIRQDEALQYVGEASNGIAAVAAIAKTQPDLVCLDLQLPGLDGLSVLRELKAVSPASRIVVVTGYPTADKVNEARELDVAGFVVKPFNAATLLSTIHTALETELAA